MHAVWRGLVLSMDRLVTGNRRSSCRRGVGVHRATAPAAPCGSAASHACVLALLTHRLPEAVEVWSAAGWHPGCWTTAQAVADCLNCSPPPQEPHGALLPARNPLPIAGAGGCARELCPQLLPAVHFSPHLQPVQHLTSCCSPLPPASPLSLLHTAGAASVRATRGACWTTCCWIWQHLGRGRQMGSAVRGGSLASVGWAGCTCLLHKACCAWNACGGGREGQADGISDGLGKFGCTQRQAAARGWCRSAPPAQAISDAPSPPLLSGLQSTSAIP